MNSDPLGPAAFKATALSQTLPRFHELLFRQINLNIYLAGVPGLEPGHAGIKIRCLNQLGETPSILQPDEDYRMLVQTPSIKLIIRTW